MCLNFLDLESNFSKKVGEWEKILAYYNDYVDWIFINSIDTHLHINKMDILTFNNYKEALKRAKKNLN